MKWIQNNKGKFIILFSIVLAIIIHIAFSISQKNPWFVAKWSAGDLLTYVSTIVLGWLAVWQNDELKKTNDESQARLENINVKANEINVISKVIEYEIGKKDAIERVFDGFEMMCNPQKFLQAIIKNSKDENDVDLNKAISDEMELDESYYRLCNKLGVPLLKDINDDEITKCVRELYNDAKKLVIDLKKKDFKQVMQDVEIIKNTRYNFGTVKGEYLLNKQKELELLISGEIRINNIKSIY